MPLSEAFPELAAEWHPTKNGDLTPDDISFGSTTKVWWQRNCVEGEPPHEWIATPNQMTRNIGKTSGCGVCRSLQVQVGVNDLVSLAPNAASEWHPTKNGELRVENMIAGSHKRVWWRCSSCEHEWQAPIERRALKGNGCPPCGRKRAAAAKRVVKPGNSIADTTPQVVSEWHPTKNGDLLPTEVNSSSHSKVWWQCELGHEWQTEVSKRTALGRNCPYCSNQKVLPGYNDLATHNPELAAEWHPTKNGDLTPTDVTPNSTRKKYWWLGKCGHEWDASNATRNKGIGCPVCAGLRVLKGFNDLESQHPEIAAEWHPTKNGAITPDMVVSHSNKKVWWQCELGHEWPTGVHMRHRTGCPVCSGKKVLSGFNDLATKDPELAAEWHPTRNGDLTPRQVVRFSGRRVWWLCDEGHEWPTTVATRSTGSGCPSCMHSGFSQAEPGWLYLIKQPDLELTQIGISNVPEQRLRQHTRRGWELIELRGPMPGDLAWNAEQAGLKAVQSRGAKLGENYLNVKFDGHTESWPNETLKLASLQQLLEWIRTDEDASSSS